MQSYVDVLELPVPAVETYRTREISPRMTIALDVDFDDSDPGSDDGAPSSDRWSRSRTWTSEEPT